MADLLDTLSRLCRLNESQLQPLLEIFRPDALQPGEHFVEAGEKGTAIAFLESGLLRSYYISPDGKEHNKHFFQPSELLAPLTSLVTGEPSPVYIGCLQEARLQIADYATLLKVYQAHPYLNKVGRILVEWAWIGKERRETQLIMLNSLERYQAFQQEFPGLEEQIPQYHIASYLGITPVQLSRLRARLGASP